MGAAGQRSGLRGALGALGDGLLHLPRGFYAGLVVGWLALISWFSSWPARGVSSLGATALVTNLGHAFLFGMLALWCALCLPRPGGRGPTGGKGAGGGRHASSWPALGVGVRVALLVLVALLGLLDETHQHMADRGRDFSLFDVVTDATGAWCLLCVAAYLRRDGTTEAGLAARVLAAVLACLAAAALATWGPRLWPGVGWL